MIEAKVKHINRTKYKITVKISGENDHVTQAELIAIHREFLKTDRGKNILFNACGELIEIIQKGKI